ncbi:MAG: homoserine kinase [Francisellaceae bacterium]|jgi:homoserine kinase type II|nr:homoserine kinase [Francisellaceae bacterium]MBT6538913.1 homoserine kinase [Francisellaceae bacterium]
MSVYTLVGHTHIEKFLHNYGLSLIQATPIKKGTVNSNYRISTNRGNYIMTIFENMQQVDISPIFSLTSQLYNLNLKCPMPIPDKQNNYIGSIANKPTAIISALPGDEPQPIQTVHAKHIGAWLGKMHYISDSIRLPKISNPMGTMWRSTTLQKIENLLNKTDKTNLDRIFSNIHTISMNGASFGFCHGDLFPDNSLFNDTTLCGVIDFYYACSSYFIYDLAICVNAWCFDDSGNFIESRYDALVTSYQKYNPLSTIDTTLWNQALQLAALRFWLSRLHSLYTVKKESMISVKNPTPMLRIIDFHLKHSLKLIPEAKPMAL